MTALSNTQQAERIVIGAALLSRDSLLEASECITPRHFQDSAHQEVWTWALNRAQAGSDIDLVTLADVVSQRDLIRFSEYPEEAMGLGVTLAGAIETLQRGAKLRRFQETAQAIHVAVKGGDVDGAQQAIDDALEDLESLSASGGLVHVAIAVDEMMTFAEERQQRKQDGEAISCPFGFTELDKQLDGGAEPNELIVVAARPGMGKTAEMVQSGMYQAEHIGPVAIFSLEMARRELAGRMLAASADVNMRRAMTGDLTRQDWDDLDTAAAKLHGLPLYIDDSPVGTVPRIESEVKKLKRRYGSLASVKIDYLQLMTGKGHNREQEVAGISRDLKKMAKRLKVPVELLAQLNRSCEARQDKRPMISDLRESGAIEQDADIVLMLYRDEYYYPDTTAEPNTLEVLVRKVRRGATGTVKLGWRWGRIFDEIPAHTASRIGGHYGM